MSELASQPTSIQSVYAMYREDKLFVNRRYQRKLVWTLEEKQRLIESIVKPVSDSRDPNRREEIGRWL